MGISPTTNHQRNASNEIEHYLSGLKGSFYLSASLKTADCHLEIEYNTSALSGFLYLRAPTMHVKSVESRWCGVVVRRRGVPAQVSSTSLDHGSKLHEILFINNFGRIHVIFIGKMVFFVCSSCGNCIKKSQVENHLAYKCRNSKCVSCMDCLKEFWGNDYKLHVKCITENEKYGGKDYVPKPTSNKGELKQEMWIEHINSTLATKKISGPLSGLLGQIVNHTNIPRKQKKFENFISNSLKIRNKRLITEAWEICAEGFKNDSNKSNNKASDAKNVKNDTSLSNGNSGSSEDSSSTKRSSDCQDDKTAKKIRLCNKENTDKSNGFDWCKASEEILQECPSGLCEKALRNQVIAKYKAFIATRGLLTTDHVILNHGQVTWTTPELAPPLLTTTPHQREDVSALDRFNVHRCPTRRVFSGTGLELMTYLPWSDTLTTGLPQPEKIHGSVAVAS
ncbi:cell growth-regulating nucleolar protein [Trichonephila clavipes]|nr:cell growth-regulating nucleolar protein [Trichonephila clavipes]